MGYFLVLFFIFFLRWLLQKKNVQSDLLGQVPSHNLRLQLNEKTNHHHQVPQKIKLTK